MMVHVPASVVLPEYTDEALTAERVYKGDVAKTLLRVPAVYRQSVEVEVNRRAYRTRERGGMLSRKQIADPHEMRQRVVTEVLLQLARAPWVRLAMRKADVDADG